MIIFRGNLLFCFFMLSSMYCSKKAVRGEFAEKTGSDVKTVYEGAYIAILDLPGILKR